MSDNKISFETKSENEFLGVQAKWQQKWEDAKVFEANPDNKEKFFVNFRQEIRALCRKAQVARQVLMSAPLSRKDLSAEGLLRTARQEFATIPDAPGHDIALVEHLMSGLAVFSLKHPSLLQFEHERRGETTRANLKAL